MAVKKKKKKNNKKYQNKNNIGKKKYNNNKKNNSKKKNNNNKKKNNINNKSIIVKEDSVINNGDSELENIVIDNIDSGNNSDILNDIDSQLSNNDVSNEIENIDYSIDNNDDDDINNSNFDNIDNDVNNDKLEKVIDIDVNTNDNIFVKYKNIFIIILIIFVLGLIVICFPKIELSGDSEMIISYKDEYVEPGYSMKLFDRDISDEIDVNSNVVDGVVGEYELEYYIDLFGIRFKKTRNVMVVDEDSPVINVDNEIINVCPNKDIPDFKYSAVDEYDGNLTSKVEKIINDNEIVLNVSDNSGNSYNKKILIEWVDVVSPVIKLKGSSVMFVNYGDKYVEPGYTVSDNCSDNLADKVRVSGNVGREIGTYTLTYEVVDDSGNKSSVTRKIIVGTKVVDNGSVNNGTIYLTFDDGPNEGTTNKILDILKEEGVKATFFVTNNGSDSLIKRMHDDGHTVALHTATHNYSYIYSSVDNYFSDLNRVSDRVKRITGIESKIIRFPGGSSNMVSRNYKVGIMTELSNLVLNQGYRYFDWNVDAMDASSARNSSDVYYNVTSNLNVNRANVVLMHDTKSITVGALRNIIRFGKDNGYSFNKIDMNTKMVRHGINN